MSFKMSNQFEITRTISSSSIKIKHKAHKYKQRIEKSYILYRMKQSEKQLKETKNEKIQEIY